MLLTCVCGYLPMLLVSSRVAGKCPHVAPKIPTFNMLGLSRHVRFKEQQATFGVCFGDNECGLLP